ncbi:S9 family peptidase [Dokdonella sp.]|uniref:S9 family peptidase n=1 Tax=Dokdonella sp. TaxID=2291710 RepID=UPI001B26AD4A|nr:S9 family peptidase [Dokdonella sp.]MBO9664769.1 S9 family peptidase [Dokdonella sp.]
MRANSLAAKHACRALALAAAGAALCACAPPRVDSTDAAPVARKVPHVVSSPNGDRVDDYYWLRDDTRSRADVLGYLRAENAYYAHTMAPLQAQADRLYDEITSRIAAEDANVPVRERGCWYQTRYEGGAGYPRFVRRCGNETAAEELLLDEAALAAGHDYYHVRSRVVSPDERLLAYAEDTSGRYQCTIRIKDLGRGETLPDEIRGTSGAIAWADDNRTFFYVENDPVTLATRRVRRHVLGTSAAEDVTVYEEPDDRYYVDLARSGDDRFLVIQLDSRTTSEARYLPANAPLAPWRILAPRESGVEYDVDHVDGGWVVRTNWQAPNFRIVQVDDADAGDKRRWREVVAAQDGTTIERVAVFQNHLALGERGDGLRRLRIVDRRDGHQFHVGFDATDYTATLGDNRVQGTHELRYDVTSLTTPPSTYRLDMRSGERTLLEQARIPGYDAAAYEATRIRIDARDGTRIPVSLAYRKGLRLDGTAPLLQIGYGAYGVSSDPRFDPAYASLLDRGFVVAVAHVRGGGEMGNAWHDAGKLLHKQNTFDDFVDVTRALVAAGYADRAKVFATGRSAGGLLMGAIANQAPRDYRAIAAGVPFVDVLTTMLDPSVPTTTNEYEEWGDPREKRYYDALLSYSPYDNVRAQDYPALFVTTSLNDSQVQYYEPAKWVARLRARKTDSQPLLFKVDMDGGHNGKSGRFGRYRETAQMYAFFLDRLESSAD